MRTKANNNPLKQWSSGEIARLMGELTQWYSDHCAIPLCNNEFVQCFKKYGKDTCQKAFILLVGKRQWYRGCHCWFLQMRVEAREQVLRILEKEKPWDSNGTYNDFEELYNEVEGWFSGVKYISQVVIYDIALRLVFLKGTSRLLPQSKVYLHGKPLFAYNSFIRNGIFANLSRSSVPIQANRVSLKTYFGNMGSIDIENLMCYAGKICWRIKNEMVSRNPADKAIDKILKPFITQFS